MFHKRTKHFDVDYHYVRERVALKALEVKHIPASMQLADVFTKSLGHEAFFKLRSKLGVSLHPTPSLKGCINQTEPITLSLTQPNEMSEEAHHQVETKHAQGVGEEGTRRRSVHGLTATVSFPTHQIVTTNRFDVLQSGVRAY